MARKDQLKRQKEIEEAGSSIRDIVDQHFGDLTDPRRAKSVRYRLLDIIFITLCAALCGANDLDAVVVYAKEKEAWLKRFLNLSKGVPCYGTFWWVFALLNASELEKCFVKWVRSTVPFKENESIAIDGKALRGTANSDRSNSFIHMVSAWSSSSNFTLAQMKVDGKSNEITAIPELLDAMEIEGAVITIDAIGCQTKITKKIIDNGADYIIGLKENQKKLYDEIVNYFDQVEDDDLENAECLMIETSNVSEKEKHGRIEERKIYTTGAIDFLPQKEEWTGLKSIVCIHSYRDVAGKISREKRYYISSLSADPKRQGNCIRSHWGIENRVHWVLDFAFQEDGLKAKAGNIGENMAVMRHMTLNLLKSEKSSKASIPKKRFKAALNEDYLLTLLVGLQGKMNGIALCLVLILVSASEMLNFSC